MYFVTDNVGKIENINNFLSSPWKETQHLLHNKNWISGKENIPPNAKHHLGRT